MGTGIKIGQVLLDLARVLIGQVLLDLARVLIVRATDMHNYLFTNESTLSIQRHFKKSLLLY